MKSMKSLALAITTALALSACGGTDSNSVGFTSTGSSPSKATTTTTIPTLPGATASTGTMPGPGSEPTEDADGITALSLDLTNRKGAGVIGTNGAQGHLVQNFYSDSSTVLAQYSNSNQDNFVVNAGGAVLGQTLAERAIIDVSSSKTNATQNVVIKNGSSTKTIPVNYSVRRVDGVTGIVLEKNSAGNNVATDKGKLTVVSTLVSGTATDGTTSSSMNAGYISGNALTSFDPIVSRHTAVSSTTASYVGRSDYLPNNATPATAADQGVATINFDLSAKQVKSASFVGSSHNVTFSASDFKVGTDTDKGNTVKATPPSYITSTSNKGVRGYFYGDAGEMTAGTFYDANGVGTFIATDTKVDSTTTSTLQK